MRERERRKTFLADPARIEPTFSLDKNRLIAFLAVVDTTFFSLS